MFETLGVNFLTKKKKDREIQFQQHALNKEFSNISPINFHDTNIL